MSPERARRGGAVKAEPLNPKLFRRLTGEAALMGRGMILLCTSVDLGRDDAPGCSLTPRARNEKAWH